MERRQSGISGLDGMLNGGFPSPSTILLAGAPGTGKTTLAVQSLFNGAKKGEKGVYITAISEPAWLVQKFLSSFEFYDEKLIENEKVVFTDLGQTMMKRPEKIFETIINTIEKHNPERIVIDPITPVIDLLQWRGEMREVMHHLFAYLKGLNTVSIITAELSYDEITKRLEGYMTDGVIMLSYPEINGVRRKLLEILKMRGTEHTTGRHMLEISKSGVTVQPGLR